MCSNIRLNRFLSLSGLYSRRQADAVINQGFVTVDGKTATVGMTVNDGSIVLVDNKLVKNNLGTRVVLFHKPKGVTCTERDIHADAKIHDFIALPFRVFSVGRLDKDSSGLLLLTNDGILSNNISRRDIEKEYIVTLNKPVTDEFILQMSRGVYLEELGKTTLPCTVEKLGSRRIKVVLTQGLNRQIRRMCQVFLYHVTDLKRVRVGNITLGELQPGAWRELNQKEVESLARKNMATK